MACAMISLTYAPPINSVAIFPPDPVIAVSLILSEGYLSNNLGHLLSKVWKGFPIVKS
jgi:hypothetical protein